ncbi:MAG: hypothetical protein JST55_12520 [Bacteroidetes bacterium]|nr:hypothetical protein [Bacteroidota bacterium]
MNKIYFLILTYFLSCTFSASAQTNVTDVKTANQYVANKDWDKAIVAFTDLIAKDKYNGQFYMSLAESYYNKKEYKKSIENYIKGIDVGYASNSAAYNIACCYSLMGDADNAISWIKTAAKYKYSNLEDAIRKDSDFDNIRNNEKFKDFIYPGNLPESKRTERWKADITYLKERMEETHYRIFDVVTKSQWDNKYSELLTKIDDMDDEHVMTEIAKIVASVGDGHTIMFPADKSISKFQSYPVKFYKFKDGLYIKGISSEYSQYTGMKATKIGTMTTEDALKKIAEVVPHDNEFGIDWQCINYLTYNYCLYGLGISDSKDVLKLELQDDNGKKVNAAIKKTETDFFKSFHSGSNDGFVYANEKSANPLPLYLKNASDRYWFELLPDINFVYMQVNAIQNKKEEKLKDFYDRVFRFIDSNNVKGIIIDLRLNSGGDNNNNKYLINNFIRNPKINQRGKVFTIIGRNTFSAAMNLTSDLENNTQTIFIGEPTGSKPNFIGEINFIELPYSGIKVSASSRNWQKSVSEDRRKWVYPEIYTPLNFSDYKNNIDPAMNAVYDYINYLKKSQ